MTAIDLLDQACREWREKATASREEAGRIRRTVYVATEAEANCNIRAEVWDKCADELESVIAKLRAEPAPDREALAYKTCEKIVKDSLPCDCAAPDIGVGVLHEPHCHERIGGFIIAQIREAALTHAKEGK